MGIKHFDVFVIGTGTAGKGVAIDCAQEGLKVAIADNREYGGTCPNRGCDPKKVLVGATEVIKMARNLQGKGVSDVPNINWKDLQKFKERFTVAIPAATEKDLKKLGIEMYHQSPKFLDKNTLSVEGKTVTADKIVIATGKTPRELKIPGRNYLLHSDNFLHQPELPEEIVFIGGGYIGMEFAHIAVRCGSKVTVIESGDRPLKGFDEDLGNILTESTRKEGVTIICNAEVTAVEKLRTNYNVLFLKDGKTKKLKAKAIFNTAGRVPSIEALDLEKGKVSFETGGVSVTKYLRNTTNKNVYACGDVSASGSLALTPISSQESQVVSQNIRNGDVKKLEDIPTPSVVFTLPQLASIGLTEKEANQQKLNVITEYKSAPHWFNAKRIGEEVYAYKTIVDAKTNLIVGAHICATHADEMINLFAMAMQSKIKASEVKKMIFAYPTWGNDIRGMV